MGQFTSDCNYFMILTVQAFNSPCQSRVIVLYIYLLILAGLVYCTQCAVVAARCMHMLAAGMNVKTNLTTILIFHNFQNFCSLMKRRPTTGCPNKHGNSVTNSISSFKIILWFSISIVIPTEKAIICKSFVCYVYNLFVYVLTAFGYT